MIIQQNLVDTLKGLGGVLGVEAISDIQAPTGSDVEVGVKVGMQIIIGIVTLFSLFRNRRQNRQ